MNKRVKEILASVLRRGLQRNLGKETMSIDQALQGIEDEVRRCLGDNLKSGLSGLDYCKGNNTRAKDFWKAWERGE